MIHGWTVRGDVADEKVRRDIEKSINLCKDYFAKFQWCYLTLCLCPFKLNFDKLYYENEMQ